MNPRVPKLKPEIKARWLEALRSGRYRQGRDVLHRAERGVNQYCCLGVLCDLAAEDGIVSRQRGLEKVSYDTQVSMPPKAVVRWAYGYDPSNDPSDDDKIADVIEEEL